MAKFQDATRMPFRIWVGEMSIQLHSNSGVTVTGYIAACVLHSSRDQIEEDGLGERRPRPNEVEALLEAWHERFRVPLLRFFERRTRPDVDREDLVQEVFARLLKRDDLTGIEHIDAYLFQTAVNVLYEVHRRRSVRGGDGHVPLEGDYISDNAISAERVILGKEAVEQLDLGLAELPERTRNVFALFHFEEVRQAEIARRFGVSLSAVEKHMSRAHHHLLKRLEPWLT